MADYTQILITRRDRQHANRMRDRYVFPGVGQKTRLRIATEHLNHVAVTASNQDEQPVGCDGEVTRMDSSVLIPNIGQKASSWILVEYRQTVAFQAVAGVKELPVRGEMDVRASPCMERISLDQLDLFEVSSIVVIHDDVSLKLGEDIHEAAVFGVGEMSGTLAGGNLDLDRFKTGDFSVNYGVTIDVIASQVYDKQELPIW